MQIKKYRVKRESKGKENIFHDLLNNSIAVPVEFEVGKRGFFVYKYNETEWHRVSTSLVISINNNIIETENTIYTFEEIES